MILMKQNKALTVLMVLHPIIFLAITGLFIWTESDHVLFTAQSVFVLSGLICCIVFSIRTKDTPAKFLSASNVWILSVNLAVFLAEMVWYTVSYMDVIAEESKGAQEGGLLLFLILVVCLPHWLVYFFTRICAAINCNRATKDLNANMTKTLHILLHLIPLVDLFSAIFVLRKVKACQSCQQPTIEA